LNSKRALPALPTDGRKLSVYFRSFFVRTLNLIVGRFAVEATRVLLRRRRRSHRASAEKK